MRHRVDVLTALLVGTPWQTKPFFDALIEYARQVVDIAIAEARVEAGLGGPVSLVFPSPLAGQVFRSLLGELPMEGGTEPRCRGARLRRGADDATA